MLPAKLALLPPLRGLRDALNDPVVRYTLTGAARAPVAFCCDGPAEAPRAVYAVPEKVAFTEAVRRPGVLACQFMTIVKVSITSG